jgi:hypothetical protein
MMKPTEYCARNLGGAHAGQDQFLDGGTQARR